MSSPSTADVFLAWLDERADSEPTFHDVGEGRTGRPISLIAYADMPEAGCLLAVTLGVSEPRATGESGTELLLLLDSLDERWLRVLAALAQLVQGEEPGPGETLSVAHVTKDWSPIEGFVVWHLMALDADDAIVHLPDGHLELVQLVPLHGSELAYLRKARTATKRDKLTRALIRDIHPVIYDVDRPPVR